MAESNPLRGFPRLRRAAVSTARGSEEEVRVGEGGERCSERGGEDTAAETHTHTLRTAVHHCDTVLGEAQTAPRD